MLLDLLPGLTVNKIVIWCAKLLHVVPKALTACGKILCPSAGRGGMTPLCPCSPHQLHDISWLEA